jgi:hypothetical protein
VKTIDIAGSLPLEIYWTADKGLFIKKIAGNSYRRCLLLDTGGIPIFVIPNEKRDLLLKLVKMDDRQFSEDFIPFAKDFGETKIAEGDYCLVTLTSRQANHLTRLGRDKPARKNIPVE